MDIALFKMSGLDFLFRWGHYLAGVAWIGTLWYFNFIQGAWFKECEPDTKKKATQLLVPRALWWFRWGAMFTFITGVVLLTSKAHMSGGMSVFNSSWGVTIMTGSLLGIIMFLNVWLVIWPNQKIVIASAKGENVGGADPAAAAAKAGQVSRHNTLFSIPLLFMMGAASHLPISIADETSVAKAMIAVGVIVLLLELNALKGKLGPLTSISGVIHSGVWLTVVLYGAIEFFC
jgi:uncharacterized membrane protein